MRVELMPHEQKIVKLSKMRVIKRLKEDLILNQMIYDNWDTETDSRRLSYGKERWRKLYIDDLKDEIRHYEKQLADVELGFINE